MKHTMYNGNQLLVYLHFGCPRYCSFMTNTTLLFRSIESCAPGIIFPVTNPFIHHVHLGEFFLFLCGFNISKLIHVDTVVLHPYVLKCHVLLSRHFTAFNVYRDIKHIGHGRSTPV